MCGVPQLGLRACSSQAHGLGSCDANALLLIFTRKPLCSFLLTIYYFMTRKILAPFYWFFLLVDLLKFHCNFTHIVIPKWTAYFVYLHFISASFQWQVVMHLNHIPTKSLNSAVRRCYICRCTCHNHSVWIVILVGRDYVLESVFGYKIYTVYSEGMTCQLKYIVIIFSISCLWMAIFLSNKLKFLIT